jgi:hypothetical protein
MNMTKDRRAGKERRNTDRFRVTMDVVWEGAVGVRRGSLSDVSLKGCFVLSTAEVQDGETVKIYLPMTDGGKVTLNAQVKNHTPDVGFAVRFFELSKEQRDMLLSYISAAGEDVNRRD